ncbi:glycosyltransferase family 25 protein [Aminobacter ciceronei]|uniref:Glycosyl transferase family 25 n=1 Tax=Aminobacter ciceronei TaxID=150723 RepID=A0ABR6BZY6_9HYPH|nr:glycosyltransferase family 25 protein [Aminobacter ciceronei]MBA8904493.1 glycosyl transferase family 25 [Aminobacter ciceronei]MBA9018271.1 glycosyl transferase family 25 [Aminobacter ciceronei]
MKIFVINLDRAPQRLERMASLFGELGLDFTRVSAVDGRDLAGRQARKGMYYDLGSGEIGCFLSHIKCWDAATKADGEYTAIFEDDVHFGAGARELLVDTIWIPADADVVKLETTLVRTLVDRDSAARAGDRSVRRLRDTHPGTGAYIVSREGARKLLELSADFADPVDQFMFNPVSVAWNALTIYQVDPAICVQEVVVGKDGAADALASGLKHERPVQEKARGTEKLMREIARPLGRLAASVSAGLRGQRWGKVRFR